MKKSLLVFAAALACANASVQADTLKKIKDSAAVTMGVRDSSNCAMKSV
jgi:glutamate/aspartate transport system substrate-binding protein